MVESVEDEESELLLEELLELGVVPDVAMSGLVLSVELLLVLAGVVLVLLGLVLVEP